MFLGKECIMAKGYQLKITIKGSHPPIWRRVIVPEFITFYDLDAIIEEVFGWTHSHLFEFYIPKFGNRFTGDMLDDFDDFDDFDDADDIDECIDPWIEEGDTFLYTYDFGDNWEHDVKVEKVVEYSHRYPTVLKYKGANMIEDCGGIWGYEEWKDEAEPFDMEKVNEIFQSWEIPIAELSEDEFLDEWEDEFPLLDMSKDELEEMLFEAMQQKEDLEEIYRNCWDEVEHLEEVLCFYKKNELQMLAQQLELSNYKKLKKAELVELLLKTLLHVDRMQMMLGQAKQEEIELFECAMEERGICISEELVESSLLLCSYGAFLGEEEFYRVPLDVQKLYKKAMTPELRKALEDKQEFKTICDAALYLYGVISLSKLTEIYNYYAQTPLSEMEIIKGLKAYKKENTDITICGDYFMDGMLAEEDTYKYLLEYQKGIEHYLPQDKEEFMRYGLEECQQPDEDTEFFVKYLEETIELSYPQALMYFYSMQEMIRMNQDDEALIDVIMEKITSQKALKKAENMINRFAKSIRKWDFCGHTFYEINQQNKVIEFQSKSKIYPNEPCPCGSGKKYKHCCARK